MRKILFFIFAFTMAIAFLVPAHIVARADELEDYVKGKMEQLDGIVATISSDGKYMHVEGNFLNKSGDEALVDTFSFMIFDAKYYVPISKMITVKIPDAGKANVPKLHYSVTLPAEERVYEDEEEIRFWSDASSNRYFLVITGATKKALSGPVEVAYGVPIKSVIVGSVAAQQDAAAESVYKKGKTIESAPIYKSPQDSLAFELIEAGTDVFAWYFIGDYYYISVYPISAISGIRAEINGFVHKSKIKFDDGITNFDVNQYSINVMRKRIPQMKRWQDVFNTTLSSPRFSFTDQIEALNDRNKTMFYTLFFGSNPKLLNAGLEITLGQLIDEESFKKLVCAYAADVYRNDLCLYAGADTVMSFLNEDEGAYMKYAAPLADKVYKEMMSQLKAIKMYNPERGLIDKDQYRELIIQRQVPRIKENIKRIYSLMSDKEKPLSFDDAYKQLGKLYPVDYPSFDKKGAYVFYSTYKQCFNKEDWKTNYEAYIPGAVDSYVQRKVDNIVNDAKGWNEIKQQIRDNKTPNFDKIKLNDKGEGSVQTIENVFTLVQAFKTITQVTDKEMKEIQNSIRETYHTIWTANEELMEAIGNGPDSYGRAIRKIYEKVLGFDVVNLPESYAAYLNVLCRTSEYSFKNSAFGSLLDGNIYKNPSLELQPSIAEDKLQNVRGQVFMTTYDRSMSATFTPGALVVFVNGGRFSRTNSASGLLNMDSNYTETSHCIGVYIGKGVFYIPYEANPTLFDSFDYETQNVEKVTIDGYDFVKITYKNERGADVFGHVGKLQPTFLEEFWEALLKQITGKYYSIFEPDHIIEPNVSLFNFCDYRPAKKIGDMWLGASSKEYCDLCNEEFIWQITSGWVPPPLESVIGYYAEE